jgi:Uma2 family endonuclease
MRICREQNPADFPKKSRKAMSAIPDFSIPLEAKAFYAMTDEEFMEFSVQNRRHLRIERSGEGEIIIGLPNYTREGAVSGEMLFQLASWNKRTEKGIVFDASAGFHLPNSVMRSANVHWISLERWNALSEEEQDKFAMICPDFVVEVKSDSHASVQVKKKIQETGCPTAAALPG